MSNGDEPITSRIMTATKQKGNIVFLAALGMMATLMASEIRELTSWSDAVKPVFIAEFMLHFGTVVGAYVAGRLIPKNGV